MKTIKDARAAAKEKWGRLSPFRIGRQVGEMGIKAKNPYFKDSRGYWNYLEGLEFGKEMRERQSNNNEE